MAIDGVDGTPGQAAESDRIEICSLDFTFRAVDDDGAMARYDALFSFRDAEDGTCYLVYCDEKPDEDGEVGTYASIACDSAQLERAQTQVESGSVPKKPPVVELAVIEDDGGWDLVEQAMALVDSEAD